MMSVTYVDKEEKVEKEEVVVEVAVGSPHGTTHDRTYCSQPRRHSLQPKVEQEYNTSGTRVEKERNTHTTHELMKRRISVTSPEALTSVI
jgi:hypothetical protein